MSIPTKIDLQIVTPERMLVHEPVDELMIPGVQGNFGVLPGHTPLLAALSVGELWYRKGQEKTYLFVVHGFAEVLPDRVSILAQLAERPEEIDADRAEKARDRAARRMGEKTEAEVDYERARLAQMKAVARLEISGRVASGEARARLKRVQREGL